MKIERSGLPKIGELIVHPFAKGNLTTDGIQYSAANSTSADTDGYVTIETGTIRLPDGITLTELEFGLASVVYGTNTTGNVGVLWQIGDTSTGFDNLHTEVTSTSSTDSATPELDVVSGRQNTTGGTNFTGANPYYVRLTIQSNSTGLRAFGKTKNSSYIKNIFRYH